MGLGGDDWGVFCGVCDVCGGVLGKGCGCFGDGKGIWGDGKGWYEWWGRWWDLWVGGGDYCGRELRGCGGGGGGLGNVGD